MFRKNEKAIGGNFVETGNYSITHWGYEVGTLKAKVAMFKELGCTDFHIHQDGIIECYISKETIENMWGDIDSLIAELDCRGVDVANYLNWKAHMAYVEV